MIFEDRQAMLKWANARKEQEARQRKILENHLAGKYNSREPISPTPISPPEHRKIRSLESYKRDKARREQTQEHANKWGFTPGDAA